MNAKRSLQQAVLVLTTVSTAWASHTLADTLSYTDQHVIVKGEAAARRDRPERVEAPSIQLGNFRIEVPTLAAATFIPKPAAASTPPRQTLFRLITQRTLSSIDEARFRSLVSDGQAEVWAPADASTYVHSLRPPTSTEEDGVHAWLSCEHGCENWVWIERRGVKQ